MDIGIIMNTMRDPAGIPASPLLFQGLMIFTWILHIAFVHLSLGAAGLSIFSFHKRDQGPYWESLSIALTKVAKISISLLIVLGVAPLLFTQVIYDPQWYFSNVISGQWTIAFIFTLIIAYCLWFVFYYANHKGAKKYIGWYAWIALALLCLDGLIMHALSYQAILPGQWMNWYQPNGIVDTSGSALHAFQWSRYLFIMSLSVPAVGLFLFAYTHYFKIRADFGPEYLGFTRQLGKRLAVWGYGIAVVPLLVWQFSLPVGTGLVSHPVGWLLLVTLVAMVWWMKRINTTLHGYLPLLGGLGVLTVLALWREIIRIQYLKPFGYSIGDSIVHTDWPSTFLFFSTLIGVGGIVGGFYLTLMYKSGRVQGLYTAERSVVRLGTSAIAILALWTAVFLIYGVVIWLRNNFIA